MRQAPHAHNATSRHHTYPWPHQGTQPHTHPTLYQGTQPHTHTTPHQDTSPTRTQGHIKAPNPTRTQGHIKAPSPTRTQGRSSFYPTWRSPDSGQTCQTLARRRRRGSHSRPTASLATRRCTLAQLFRTCHNNKQTDKQTNKCARTTNKPKNEVNNKAGGNAVVIV
jgi:hypothetical protein